MKKLFLAILATISIMANLKEIDEQELIKMQKDGVVVIDIRTPAEWKQRGIIKGSYPIMFFTPRGEADVANFMFELGHIVKNKKQPFIIYCAHANRTKELGKWLINNMNFENVYELKGGIEYGWIDKGLKTEAYK